MRVKLQKTHMVLTFIMPCNHSQLSPQIIQANETVMSCPNYVVLFVQTLVICHVSITDFILFIIFSVQTNRSPMTKICQKD